MRESPYPERARLCQTLTAAEQQAIDEWDGVPKRVPQHEQGRLADGTLVVDAAPRGMRVRGKERK